MGQIITFYSYKGGTGRSMALANISILLAKWGFNVLIIDWDLEAPGLEYFFAETYNFSVTAKHKGIIDILLDCADYQTEQLTREKKWKDITKNIFENENDNGKLDILIAGKGKRDKEYFQRIKKLDFNEFYSKFNGGEIIEDLRNQWKDNYDFVLIDSRTGVTDIGGICTIQLPDILVLLFSATKQAFEGILNIAKIADKAQKSLLTDRLRLLILPIPSKFDSRDEFKLSQKWVNDFSKRLKFIYENWLPTSVKEKDILEVTKIPYISYFSFGEKLPVIEQGTTDPTGLGYAYENIAALIADNFQHVEMIVENRDELVDRASTAKKREAIAKPKIFISYSHKDTSYKDLILKHLSVLSVKNEVSIWSDKEIQPGHDWYTQIEKEISGSNVALLLISADFLTSSFIMKEEISLLLKRQKSSNLIIIPIIIRPCAWQQVSFLSNLQVFPKDGIPFSSLAGHELEKNIANLVGEIASFFIAQPNGRAANCGSDQDNLFKLK
ncbi:ATP/GTP-binding protein [Candidatus Magnetomorum sp. HK-1]|nr:ATP/GTP-binding protein [Candidatus Magnetomorum sp. HK-1]